MIRKLLSIIGVYKVYEKWLMHQVKGRGVPEHVALILDGNRRWARSRGLPPWVGHRFGAEKVKDVLKWSYDLNIKILTLYILSMENLQRPLEEVKHLMELLEARLREVLEDEEVHKKKVRIKVLGRIEMLPPYIQRLIERVEEATYKYGERFLNLAIAYGGRAEVVDSLRRIAEEVKEGSLSPREIDEKTVERYLYTSHLPNPYPDLVIRTSNEQRLSGFLLWQASYSELIFTDVLWPSFRKIDFLRAIRTYQGRSRRFGK